MTFPVDLVALLERLFMHLFRQLLPFIAFFAVPFLILHEVFQIQLDPEELEEVAQDFRATADRRLLRLLL